MELFRLELVQRLETVIHFLFKARL